ncbi:unnamed protein product [Arabidopsis halleri]
MTALCAAYFGGRQRSIFFTSFFSLYVFPNDFASFAIPLSLELN